MKYTLPTFDNIPQLPRHIADIRFEPGLWDNVARSEDASQSERIVWLQLCCQALAGELKKAQAIDDYDAFVVDHLNPNLADDNSTMLMVGALGLAGEVGELIERIKKALFHELGENFVSGHPKTLEELGDVLYYLVLISNAAGFRLARVMAGNVVKLNARYPKGTFDPEIARLRADVSAPREAPPFA